MRLFIIIFILFLSAKVLAQSADASSKDTSKHFMIVDAKHINQHEKILYVIDGKSYYKASIEKNVDINGILYLKVLKPNEALIKYGELGKKGAIIITSKKFAVNSYQAKLSSFSEEYKACLSRNQNKDNDFEYVLNGSALDNSSYDSIKKLYKIPSESIKRVDFLINPSHNGYTNKKEIVNILTND